MTPGRSCSCVYVDVEGTARLISEKVVRARTQHVCGECGETIKPGQRYERFRGVYDDKPMTHRTCETCLDLRSTLFCGGWTYGGVREDLHEHVVNLCGEIDSSCLLALTPRARGVVLDMIDTYWENDDWENDDEEV